MDGMPCFVLLFVLPCVAIEEKLAPLRSACISSVQCVGVAVCVDNVCRCPPSYTPIGNTCVHSGFENGLSSDQLQVYISERLTEEKDNQDGFQGTDGIRIGSSLYTDKQPGFILTKLGSTSMPFPVGYPGQPCGPQNECRGNSFCYKGLCSCHAGAVVSGRICATITSGTKTTRVTAVTAAPRTRTTSRPTLRPPTMGPREPLGVEQICPPPLFWADGDCMVPATMPPTTVSNFGTQTNRPPAARAAVAICKPPLVVVDGWCTLPEALAKSLEEVFKETRTPPPRITPIPLIRCQPPSMWVDGQCVSPPRPYTIPANPYMASYPGQLPVPPPSIAVEPMPVDLIQPVAPPAPSPIAGRRCPPGEIVINSACLSTEVVVNYPSPLLCRTGNECPGGSTCLSHFCVCPAPFVWQARTGCDSPSMVPSSIESPVQYPGAAINGETMGRIIPSVPSGYRPMANGYVQLGGRCSRDNDCIERAVCDLGTCACRAPFIPYSSMCIFAPTEEEIASAIQ